MNWDQVEGQWKQISGKVREKWGKFTNDDIESIAGKKDRLIGKLKSKYGHSKEAAERELNDFTASMKSTSEKVKSA